MRFSKDILIFFVFLALFPIKGLSKRGGYLRFEFLCYKNLGHLDHQGYNCDSVLSKECDPYFSICISNRRIEVDSPKSCSVLLYESPTYYDKESVCNVPHDNREQLKSPRIIEIPFPLQREYYIRIVVRDYNSISAHGYIAVFQSSFNKAPSPNFQGYTTSVLTMHREERRVYNPNARLSISIGLMCEYNLYGDYCQTFCKASPNDNYVCSQNGTKVCKTGWIGNECVEKDLCSYFQCAKGAKCLIIDKTPKCFCNDTISPECYLNYNPCNPNPCENGGKCVKDSFTGSGVSCNCEAPYHGSRCRQKYNLCQIDPCLNNGTCTITSPGTRICQCPPNYNGILCEHYDDNVITPSNETNSISFMKTDGWNYGLLFGVLFGLSLLILAMGGIYFLLIFKREPVSKTNKEIKVSMKDLHHVGPIRSTSGTYDTYREEAPYDIIDDRAMYVYQINNNDDYLVPSKTTSPAISPNDVSGSSDYLPMYNEATRVEEKEDKDELPALPTRNIKKTKFKLFGSSKK